MQKKFIIFIVLVIIIVAVGGYFLNRSSGNSSGKFDQFAQALKEKGAKFYGAFWCTHCQSQKAEFGSSKKYLPYVECANPNNTPVQTCLDAKIDSYPSWTFPEGVKIISDKLPLVCDQKTDKMVDTTECKGKSSINFKTWFFEDYNFSIKSPTDPIRDGNIWQFPTDAQTSGELPLTFLAEQINFTLPE